MNRRLLHVCQLVPLLLAAKVGYSDTNTNDWGGRIVSKKHHSIASLLFVHVDAVNILVVDGKRFENVRGIKGFYIPIPELVSILFVEDKRDYSVTFHV